MVKKFTAKTERSDNGRAGRRTWSHFVRVMAMVVVFCTTYALILPAITLESKTICGIGEHTHTADCYQAAETVACTIPESEGHAHSDACYTTEENALTCALEESVGHTHSDTCNGQTLVCTLEETAAHAHSAACTGETKTLTCTEPESETHTHTDTCYKVEVLSCALAQTEGHAHSGSCYETGNVCGLEETAAHTHSDACCGTAKTLTCTLAESEGHSHADDEQSLKLICEINEHVHTEECYPVTEATTEEPTEETEQPVSDPTADVETAADWEASMAAVELTGDWSVDLLNIARSQMGYTESTRNFVVSESGSVSGYTRYGAWYGIPYGDWCAMFVSFCLEYAGVEDISRAAGCNTWMENLIENNQYFTADKYTPVPGDIMFIGWDEDDRPDHVGIVEQIIIPEITEDPEEQEPVKVRVIEGNSSNRVQYVDYAIDDECIMGYGVLPTEHGPTYEYSDDSVQVSVVLPLDTTVPETAVLSVTPIESGAEEYDSLVERANDAVDGTVTKIKLYDISFYTESGEYIPVGEEAKVSLRFVESVVDVNANVEVLHFADEEQTPVVLAGVTAAEETPAVEEEPKTLEELSAPVVAEPAEDIVYLPETVVEFTTDGFSVFAVVEVATRKIDITGKTFDMINVDQNNALDERIVMIATADAFDGKYYAMTSNANGNNLQAVEVVRKNNTVTVPADSYNAFAFKFIANTDTEDVLNDYYIQSLATGKYLALDQNYNNVTLSDAMQSYHVATATNGNGDNFNWISMITTNDTVQGEVQESVERDTQGRELAYDNVNGCFTTYGNSIDGDTNVNRAKMVLVDINGVIETDVIPVNQAVGAEGGDTHPLDGKIIAINNVFYEKTRSFTHTFVDNAAQAGENLRGMTAEADVNGTKYMVSDTALWKFFAVDGKPNIYKIAAYDYTTEKVGKYLDWAGNDQYINLTDEAGADEILVGANVTAGFVRLQQTVDEERYLAYSVDDDLIVSYDDNDEQDNFVLSEVTREETPANEVIEGLGNRYYMILGVNLNGSDAAVRLMHEPVEGGFLGEVVDDFGKNGNNLTEKDFNDYTNATWFFEPAGEGTYFIRTATFEDGAEQATLGDYINISADGLTLSKAKQAIQVVKAAIDENTNPNYDTNAVCLRVDVNKQVLRYEAEDAQLGGIAVAEIPSPGSGDGHVGNIGGDANVANKGTATFTVNSNTNANAFLTICYAQAENRTVYVSVNDQAVSTTGFAYTGGWTDFSGRVTVPVTLNAGANTIVLSNPDAYGPNIDYIEVAFQESGTYKYEMEDGTLAGVASIVNNVYVDNVGYNGTVESTVTHTVTMPAAATATLRLSYATYNQRTVVIKVNGKEHTQTCDATGNWDVFGTIDIENIDLIAGENTIIFGNAAGYAPNLDSFELIVGNEPSYQSVNLHGNNLEGYFSNWYTGTDDPGNHLLLAEFQKVDNTLDELDELLAGLVVDGDGYSFSDQATPGSAGPDSGNDGTNQGYNDNGFPAKYDAAVEYRARMQELARKLYKIYEENYDAATGEWTDLERSYLLNAIESITGKTVEDFMADIKWLGATIQPIQASVPNVTVQLFNYNDSNDSLKDTDLWAGGFKFYHQGGVHNPYTAVDGSGDSTDTMGRDDETMYMSSFLSAKEAPVITYGRAPNANGVGTALQEFTLPMDEVFGNGNKYEVTKEKGAMLQGGGLFLFDQSSHMYYYHSDRNAATYDPVANKFKLYDAVIRPMYISGGDANYALDYPNLQGATLEETYAKMREAKVIREKDNKPDRNYRNINGEIVPLNPSDRYNFLPFNNVENIIFDKHGMNTTTSHVDSIETSGYLNERADMWFGMKIETEFFQPNDGKVENMNMETGKFEKDDMIFRFFGDDDVFVYINGILVLDIGGTHGASSGLINFATGEVTYDIHEQDKGPGDEFPDKVSMNIRDLLIERVVNGVSGRANADDYITIAEMSDDQVNEALEKLKKEYEIEFQMVNGKWILKEFKHYNFKFFYMERGGNVSYNGIEFNLLALPEDSLTLKKEFDTAGAIDSGKTFTYKVLKADADRTRYEMENGTMNGNAGPVTEGVTASGGAFVGNVDEAGVTHTVESDTDCEATLIFAYGQQDTRDVIVTVNDESYNVDCYNTQSWTTATNTAELLISLKKGDNTITFAADPNDDSDNEYAPNLDYFEIQTGTVLDTGVIADPVETQMSEGDPSGDVAVNNDHVGNIKGNSDTVTHTVTAAKDGLAELRITYATQEDRDISVVVNGDTDNPYEMTGWATSAENSTTQKTVVMYVTLKEGQNTLTFGGRVDAAGTEYYAPDLYSFELSSADQNLFAPNTPYTRMDLATGRVETDYVTPEGYIYLKGGEQAVFDDIFDGYDEGNYPDYVVQEVLESGEYGQYSVKYKVTGVEVEKQITTPISGNDSGVRYTYHYQTAVVDTGDYTTSEVDYINTIQEPVGSLKVSKVLAVENEDAYADTDFTFTLEVCNIPVGEGDSVTEKNDYLNTHFHTVPDGTPYTLYDKDDDPVTYVDDAGEVQTIRYTKDGRFSMKAGQYVMFEGFVAGTYFRVKEVDTGGKIFRISYDAEVVTTYLAVNQNINYVTQAGETASSGWGMFGYDGNTVAVQVTNADALCDASVGVRKLISNWAGVDNFTFEVTPVQLKEDLEPKLDVDGNPVLDDNNNPVMVGNGTFRYVITDQTESNVTIMTAAVSGKNESTGGATKIITFNRSAIGDAWAKRVNSTTKYFRFHESDRSTSGNSYVYDSTEYIVEVTLSTNHTNEEIADWEIDDLSASVWTAEVTKVWKANGDVVDMDTVIGDAYNDPDQADADEIYDLQFTNHRYTRVTLKKVLSGDSTNNKFIFNVAVTTEDPGDPTHDPKFDLSILKENEALATNEFLTSVTDREGKDTEITDGTFTAKLGHNEFVTFWVPYGSKVVVTESGSDGYYVKYDVTVDNAGQSPTSGYGATATVGSVAGVTTVTFTNTPGEELPMTGGEGTLMYILGGLFMMAVPVVYYGISKRSRRERRAGA